jgi:acetoin utilization deacetylase AcuC-like enzyme
MNKSLNKLNLKLLQYIMVVFDSIYVHPLPSNHRFPMEKYDLLHRQLIYEGTINENDVIQPASIEISNVERVHCPNYLEDLISLNITPRAQRKTGFVHSQKLIERELTIMEGTRMAAEIAIQTNIAFNIAGGTHHAFHERGEGFCLLNDQVIASKWLLHKKLVSSILIIDLDVHQGNGTAALCANEPEIFTFSMHGKNNYPLKKEKSNLDIELEDKTDDKTYLYQLESQLENIGNKIEPDFIFYQCGVDILESDKLGRLGISRQGCKIRDQLVFEFSKQLNVPIVCTMGGGYSEDIKNIVEAHSNTFREGLNMRY